jgi:hypothetical protein
MYLFKIPPKLIAEIDQAHSLGVGMLGVAFEGGISSGPISRTTQLEPSSLPKGSQVFECSHRWGFDFVLGYKQKPIWPGLKLLLEELHKGRYVMD